MKRNLAAMLLLVLFVLTGCRTRITAGMVREGAGTAAEHTGMAAASEAAAPDDVPQAQPEETAESGTEAASLTREKASAERREYDEQASAEVAVGAARKIAGPGEGNAPAETAASRESASPADRLEPKAEKKATQKVLAEHSDRKTASENAEDTDTVLLYYTVLLKERLDSQFECQRLNAYLELQEEYRTVYKTSPEHRLLLASGCYDVSARLLEENLIVEPGWVQRKDPGIIIKVVDRTVLGYGVSGSDGAQAVRSALLARPEWKGIDAVRRGRVLMVSEQLFASQHLQTALMLYIAKMAAPELFSDVDPEEALRRLSQEEAGSPAEGLFVYGGE